MVSFLFLLLAHNIESYCQPACTPFCPQPQTCAVCRQQKGAKNPGYQFIRFVRPTVQPPRPSTTAAEQQRDWLSFQGGVSSTSRGQSLFNSHSVCQLTTILLYGRRSWQSWNNKWKTNLSSAVQVRRRRRLACDRRESKRGHKPQRVQNGFRAAPWTL